VARSSFPSPALDSEPRAKSLGLQHDPSLSSERECNSPPKSHSRREKTHQHDSANLEAAKKLYRLREATGLTQAKVAALTGESVQQVRRREAGKVFLGPLRALVVLERAAGQKAKK
jgi:DNA-binding transcriptional regulator YiaG